MKVREHVKNMLAKNDDLLIGQNNIYIEHLHFVFYRKHKTLHLIDEEHANNLLVKLCRNT